MLLRKHFTRMKNLLGLLLTRLILTAAAAGLWLAGVFVVRTAADVNWTSDPILLLSAFLLLSALTIASSFRSSKRWECECRVRREIYEAVALAWQGALRAAPAQSGG